MIDTNELRAGNWVMKMMTNDKTNAEYGYKMVSEEECFFTFASAYLPIMITPDILGKSSFRHAFGDWYKNIEAEGVDDGLPFLRYKQKSKQWYLFGQQLPYQPLYLHQLQNLYYALTNKELRITLEPVEHTSYGVSMMSPELSFLKRGDHI
jgi:hypothetical protein